MGTGWVYLDKLILDSRLWSYSPATTKVAIYLILSANFKRGWVKGVEIKRGQTCRSLHRIADENGLSVKAVRHALHVLCRDGFISKDSPFGAKQGHRITVCNYAHYQTHPEKRGKRRAHEGTHEGTPNKEEEEGEEEEEIPPIVPQRVDYSDPDIDLLLISQEGWQDAWDGWKESRIAKGKKATKRAKELILKRLAERPDQAIEALNATVENGWSSFKWHYLEDKNTKEANNADIWNSPRLSQK